MLIQSEIIPVAVPETTKQAGEVRSYDWVERSIWTERMLGGGERRSLVQLDHFRWPNKFLRENGLLSLVDAHQKLLQSSLR